MKVLTPTRLTRYRTVRRPLRFSAEALAHDGRTIAYRYWVQSPGTERVLVANCTIPNTTAAIHALHRRFHVGPESRVTFVQNLGDEGEIVMQQLCGTSGGACELQAIDVVVGGCTDPDWTRGEDGVCRSDRNGMDGGSGGGGGGDWSGGGSGGDPSSEDPPATAPDGIDQGEYDKLNRAEKWLCVQSQYECSAVIVSGHDASAWAREQTPELLKAEADNKRDALRHAAWQATLTRLTNENRAKLWGDAHETSSLNPMSTCMDQWNNAVGRGIGARAGNVYDGVLTAWSNGQLKGAPFSC